MKSWRIPAWQRSLQELSCSLPQPSSAKPMQKIELPQERRLGPWATKRRLKDRQSACCHPQPCWRGTRQVPRRHEWKNNWPVYGTPIEHVFGAQQNAPVGRIVRTIGIVRARANILLAVPSLQHSPPGDAGTARRGMKTVELSALFQPEAVGGKSKRGRQSKTGPNPNLCPIRRQNRTLFEVPYSCLSLGRRHSE